MAAASVRVDSSRRLEVAFLLFARLVLKGTFEKKTALKDVFLYCQDTEQCLRRALMASSTRNALARRRVPQAACHKALLTTTAASVVAATTLLQARLLASLVKPGVPMLFLVR